MLDRKQLATPRRHGQVLVEPPAAAQRNSLTAAHDDGTLLDRPLAAVRRDLRRRLGWSDPVVITGHQAEFIHPGVFAKTIAAAAVTPPHGTGVYLTVDSDTPKTAALPVPLVHDRSLRLRRLGLPDVDPRLPLEGQAPLSRRRWQNWFAEVRDLLPGPADWFDIYVAGWLAVPDGGRLADAFVAAQRACEASLDIRHEHIATSELSAWPEFRAYLLHIARDAERFASLYNDAQQAYRARHGVRTVQRPVPPLQIAAARIELPFWVRRAGGLRQRLAVSRGRRVMLLAGGEPIGPLPETGDWSAALEPLECERDGWQLRPRALTLSGFARLVLGNLFLHGIGGAKYDELTDAFTGAFWGRPPEPLACVSAALLLDLPHDPQAAAKRDAARRRARDVRHNPQRQLEAPDPELTARRADLVQAGRDLAERERHNRVARRANYRALQGVNAALVERHAGEVARIEAAVPDAQQRVAEATIARSREYFHGLFARDAIEQLTRAVRDAYSAD